METSTGPKGWAEAANCFYAYTCSDLSSNDCISWGQRGFFGPSTHGICRNGKSPHLHLSMENKRQTALYLKFETARDPVLSRQECGSCFGVHVLY